MADKKNSLTRSAGSVDNVKVRMYCMGTGDCFILKFCKADTVQFTMMIDCGSCQGSAGDFKPYIDDLAAEVNNRIDLLVVTHEHNDHVNGFAKCASTFGRFDIGEAWFAWTEDPDDPTGAAAELQKKRSKIRNAFANALNKIKSRTSQLENELARDFYNKRFLEGHKGYINGLDTLAQINLAEEGDPKESLPGMVKIKEILKAKKVRIRYLSPGTTIKINGADGFKFHVLGPPMSRNYVFKDGKEGTDVYNKKLSLDEDALPANALLKSGEDRLTDLPFASPFVIHSSTASSQPADVQKIVASYNDAKNAWRNVDHDWLNSAGSLALRLNTHINNTSLVLAVEFDHSKKVLLLPGDAEYGSWESWHNIETWKPKKEGDKHFVEDLLNRTVFYKVGHHLSYNGTALQKGIMMMQSDELAAMATLDRNRIASGWKSTMPNKHLMQELIRRCGGKLFIMDEFEIKDGPSKHRDEGNFKEGEFITGKDDKGRTLFIQYTVNVE